jgi:hypothetical protein
MNIKKQEYEKDINEQYNNKGKIYVLIRKKQQEQENEIEENKQKVRDSILRAQNLKKEMKREKLEKDIEARKQRESDPEYILKKERKKQLDEICNNAVGCPNDGYWYAVDGTMTPKPKHVIEKERAKAIEKEKNELYKKASFCNFE